MMGTDTSTAMGWTGTFLYLFIYVVYLECVVNYIAYQCVVFSYIHILIYYK